MTARSGRPTGSAGPQDILALRTREAEYAAFGPQRGRPFVAAIRRGNTPQNRDLAAVRLEPGRIDAGSESSVASGSHVGKARFAGRHDPGFGRHIDRAHA